MDKQQKEDGHTCHHPDDKPSDEVPIKPKFRLFPPGYFANNDWAILLFGLAILFGGAIIPTTSDARKVCAWLCIACCAVLVIHAMYNRNALTDEEIDEQFRQATERALGKLENKLEGLDGRLAQTETAISQQSQRALSEMERRVIVAELSRFRGQKIIVFHKWDDGEGSAYASGFVTALSNAGWDFSKGAFTRPQMFLSSYRNAMVGVSNSLQPDADGSRPIPGEILPEAAVALMATLFKLGITDQPSQLFFESDLAPDEISLRISSRGDKP